MDIEAKPETKVVPVKKHDRETLKTLQVPNQGGLDETMDMEFLKLAGVEKFNLPTNYTLGLVATNSYKYLKTSTVFLESRICSEINYFVSIPREHKNFLLQMQASKPIPQPVGK